MRDRLLDPVALVLKQGVWYLVARCDGVVRTYRVDRIQDVRPTGARFDRDPAFDLRRFWADHAVAFQRQMMTAEITLRLSQRHPVSGAQELRWPSTGSSQVKGQRSSYLPCTRYDAASAGLVPARSKSGPTPCPPTVTTPSPVHHAPWDHG